MVEFNRQERTIRIKIAYYGPAVGGKTTNLKVLYDRARHGRRGEFVSVNSQQDRTILCDLLPLRSSGFMGYDLRFQLAAVPGQLVRLAGALTTRTSSLTVRVALLVRALPQVPLTITL